MAKGGQGRLKMSYARFSDSDVYIFLNVGGWLECCACLLGDYEEGDMFPESKKFYKTDDMIKHLEEHIGAGHEISPYTIADLLEDKENNDEYIFQKNAG